MREIGDTICFATSYNAPGKHDGDEFVREMVKFNNLVGQNSFVASHNLLKPTGKAKGGRRNDLRDQFYEYLFDFKHVGHMPGIKNFVFFMHGTWRALLGIGHNIWSTCTVADLIKLHGVKDETINIVLYACSCGRGKGIWRWKHEYDLKSNADMRGEFGFAMRLAKDLSDVGVHDYRIYAHTGAGHTTRYPHCVWITEEDNVIKRRKIVPYRSWASTDRKGRRQWIRWVNFLHKTPEGRFRAPFLTEAELAEVIGK